MKNTNNEIIRITHIDKMSGKHPHGLKPLPRSDQPLLLSVGGRVCLIVYRILFIDKEVNAV